jgi:molybdopterin converting factor small subunit
MKVNIIAYGIAKEIVGGQSGEMEFSEHSSLSKVKDALVKKYPAFAELRKFSIAVNESYREDDYIISEGDELVIIPPVSGG